MLRPRARPSMSNSSLLQLTRRVEEHITAHSLSVDVVRESPAGKRSADVSRTRRRGAHAKCSSRSCSFCQAVSRFLQLATPEGNVPLSGMCVTSAVASSRRSKKNVKGDRPLWPAIFWELNLRGLPHRRCSLKGAVGIFDPTGSSTAIPPHRPSRPPHLSSNRSRMREASLGALVKAQSESPSTELS